MISSWKCLLEIFAISLLTCSCLANSGGMIALTNSIADHQPEVSDNLSKKELKSIYGVAKNISHSKGPIIKSKENDYEYRRSFTNKVEFEVHSLQLKNVIMDIKNNITQNSYEKSVFLENLDFLESLVHQYDIGKQFADLGGFQLILSLARNEDSDISKAAFIILSAAMQGNQEVQVYATTTDLLKILDNSLTSSLPDRTKIALHTLSTFVRNCPEALVAFLEERGIQTLSNLLTKYYAVTKIQMRIVDLLRDMTAEIYDENPDTVSPILLRIKKNFSRDIEQHSMCDKLINIFLTFKEYKAHEKMVSALSTMFEVCKRKFGDRKLLEEVKTLMKLYDPFKTAEVWFKPLIDAELRYYIFQELKEFLEKLLHNTPANKFNFKVAKTEL